MAHYAKDGLSKTDFTSQLSFTFLFYFLSLDVLTSDRSMQVSKTQLKIKKKETEKKMNWFPFVLWYMNQDATILRNE